MLAIHDPEDYDNLIPMQFDDDSDWHVTHAYNGNDTLTFEIPTNSKYYKYIAEETKIDFTGSRMRDSRFVVKNVDEHSDFVTVNANIDLEDWQQNIIFEFRETNSYLYEILDKIIPSGWTYQGADVFDKRTTVEDTEGQPIIASTPLGILDKCPSAYGCVFNFDVVNNILLVIDPTEIESSGEYFTDELNLRSLGFVGNSDNFATRLYAYGKRDENGENPVTFESINDGKPYVEDKSYVNKVVSVGWSDERYETPQTLLNAAREKLSELAKPTRSYSCEISDLGDNVWLYMVVTLIDRRRGTRVDHQIIEWNEYNHSYLDSVTLSATQPTINGLIDQIDDDFQDTINNIFVGINDIVGNAVDNATDLITGNQGGQFVWVFDEEGRPKELVNLADTDDINTAQKVWRWNASGLGHSNNGYNGQYELALLADGSINASMITTGILNAGVIRAGVITDVLGRNYWNLETGEFSLSASTTVDGEPIVVRLDTQFAVNTSSTNAPSSGWSTNVPSYDPSTQFLWSRTATVYANGNVSYSDPICLSAQGTDGKDGVGIDDVIDQYYLSTLSTTQSGGSWSTTQPTWQPNRYIWQRMQIEWSDGTTTTTAPYLANALNSANKTAHDAEQAVQDLNDSLDQLEIFNRLTHNGQTQGIYLQDNKIYINGEYIRAGTISTDRIESPANSSTNIIISGSGTSSNFVFNSSGEEIFQLVNFTQNAAGMKASGLYFLEVQPAYGSNGAYLWICPPLTSTSNELINPKILLSEDSGFVVYVNSGSTDESYPYLRMNKTGFYTTLDSNTYIQFNDDPSFWVYFGSSNYLKLDSTSFLVYLASTRYFRLSSDSIRIVSGDTETGTHPNIYMSTSGSYFRHSPTSYLYLTTSSFSLQGGSSGYPRVHGTSSSVTMYFNSTHYVQVSGSNLYCRCGNKGFGMSGGTFSSNLTWN